MDKPRYKCTDASIRFIGQVDDQDAYYCQQHQEIILRFGDRDDQFRAAPLSDIANLIDTTSDYGRALKLVFTG